MRHRLFIILSCLFVSVGSVPMNSSAPAKAMSSTAIIMTIRVKRFMSTILPTDAIALSGLT